MLQDRRLDQLRLARLRQAAPLQRLQPRPGAIEIGPQRQRPSRLDPAPGQPLLQFGQQVLGRRISQPLGGVLHHPVDFHQPRRRQQRSPQAVAVARVVVGQPKAIRSQQLLDVLAQAGQFPGPMAARNRR